MSSNKEPGLLTIIVSALLALACIVFSVIWATRARGTTLPAMTCQSFGGSAVCAAQTGKFTPHWVATYSDGRGYYSVDGSPVSFPVHDTRHHLFPHREQWVQITVCFTDDALKQTCMSTLAKYDARRGRTVFAGGRSW